MQIGEHVMIIKYFSPSLEETDALVWRFHQIHHKMTSTTNFGP